MQNKSSRTQSKVRELEKRVAELERQLAHAHAALQTTTLTPAEELPPGWKSTVSRLDQEMVRQLAMDRFKLAMVIEYLPVGIWVADETGALIAKNEQADQIWAGEAPLSRSVEDYAEYEAWFADTGEKLKPEDYPFARALRTGQPVVPVELKIRRFDGSEGTVLASAVPIRDDEGAITGIVGVNVDITERKHTEEALRKSEERFSKTFHTSPDAIVISRMSDGLIVEVNESWRRYFGYERSELIGRTSLEIGLYVNPADRGEAIARLHKEGILRNYEVQIHHKSGEVRLVSMSANTIEIDKVDYLIVFLRDVTEQKRSEQALRESKERFHALADSMPQLVWTALPDGTVDYYNSRYLEYRSIKQEKDSNWDWVPVLHVDDALKTVQAWLQAVQTGETYQMRHRVRMVDGSYRWHLSRAVPVRGEDGQIVRWYGTATDIQDLISAQENLREYTARLEHSNYELEQFAFMASHDLQEPLRKIEMYGDLLRERQENLNDQELAYLDRMGKAAGRMRDMVEGLLQLSRITSQDRPFTRVDLGWLVRNVLADLDDQIRKTGAKVQFEDLPTVEGDPLQLHQLMSNLIGNALKYHKDGAAPVVQVQAELIQGKVYIHVKDQGIGFPQEEAERIFQPFQRLVGRSRYEGSGIGLAICRRIVERHNGEIAALGEPERGATFIVTLPLEQPDRVKNEVNENDIDASSIPASRRRRRS